MPQNLYPSFIANVKTEPGYSPLVPTSRPHFSEQHGQAQAVSEFPPSVNEFFPPVNKFAPPFNQATKQQSKADW
ncbi:MAG: hypothetical protein AB2705_07880, partial [Candidatus Thiodiazotropha sp.]